MCQIYWTEEDPTKKGQFEYPCKKLFSPFGVVLLGQSASARMFYGLQNNIEKSFRLPTAERIVPFYERIAKMLPRVLYDFVNVTVENGSNKWKRFLVVTEDPVGIFDCFTGLNRLRTVSSASSGVSVRRKTSTAAFSSPVHRRPILQRSIEADKESSLSSYCLL